MTRFRYTYVCEDCCHGWQFEEEVDLTERPPVTNRRCSMCGEFGTRRGHVMVVAKMEEIDMRLGT